MAQLTGSPVKWPEIAHLNLVNSSLFFQLLLRSLDEWYSANLKLKELPLGYEIMSGVLNMYINDLPETQSCKQSEY